MPDIQAFGESFTPSGQISEFSLMEFADAAEDAEKGSLAALAAVMRLLREAIAPEDWDRFKAAARREKANAEQLLPVIFAAYEDVSGRPTERPSDSSAGPQTTTLRSTDGSSSPVVARLETQGRPDLALMVTMAQDARSA